MQGEGTYWKACRSLQIDSLIAGRRPTRTSRNQKGKSTPRLCGQFRLICAQAALSFRHDADGCRECPLSTLWRRCRGTRRVRPFGARPGSCRSEALAVPDARQRDLIRPSGCFSTAWRRDIHLPSPRCGQFGDRTPTRTNRNQKKANPPPGCAGKFG